MNYKKENELLATSTIIKGFPSAKSIRQHVCKFQECQHSWVKYPPTLDHE